MLAFFSPPVIFSVVAVNHFCMQKNKTCFRMLSHYIQIMDGCQGENFIFPPVFKRFSLQIFVTVYRFPVNITAYAHLKSPATIGIRFGSITVLDHGWSAEWFAMVWTVTVSLLWSWRIQFGIKPMASIRHSPCHMFIGIIHKLCICKETEGSAAASGRGVKMIPSFAAINQIPPVMPIQTNYLDAGDICPA